MWFGHTDTAFSLEFRDRYNDYSFNCLNGIKPDNVFNNNLNWGLGYNLGFDKTNSNIITSNDMSLNTLSTSETFNRKRFNYMTPSYNNSSDGSKWDQSYNLWRDFSGNNPMRFYIVSPHAINIQGDKCMYMEVEKYNSYDELYPYNESTFSNNEVSNITKKVQINGNNSYNGQINSAFAKIPLITHDPDNYVFESRNGGLQNITHYDPPLERLGRLKFKFRFHDGRLVDFQNNPFNFTLEFNMLRSEMSKQYNVRIPSTYTL